MSLGDKDFERHRREFTNASIFAVTVGTTGPQGGDAGHGSRVEVILENLGATAWEVEVDGQLTDHPTSVTIRVGGDSEGTNLAAALEFAALTLRQEWGR